MVEEALGVTIETLGVERRIVHSDNSGLPATGIFNGGLIPVSRLPESKGNDRLSTNELKVIVGVTLAAGSERVVDGKPCFRISDVLLSHLDYVTTLQQLVDVLREDPILLAHEQMKTEGSIIREILKLRAAVHQFPKWFARNGANITVSEFQISDVAAKSDGQHFDLGGFAFRVARSEATGILRYRVQASLTGHSAPKRRVH
jgi:hypothetical protein